MDYDPAHKASSITSTTSTNSSSTTWEQQPPSLTTTSSDWPPMLFYYYNHLNDNSIPLFHQEFKEEPLSSALPMREEYGCDGTIVLRQQEPTSKKVAQQTSDSIDYCVDDYINSFWTHIGKDNNTSNLPYTSSNKNYNKPASHQDISTAQQDESLHERTKTDIPASSTSHKHYDQLTTAVHEAFNGTEHRNLRSIETVLRQESNGSSSITSNNEPDSSAISLITDSKSRQMQICDLPFFMDANATSSIKEAHVAAASSPNEKPDMTTMVFSQRATPSTSKVKKPNKSNHIASEQKRRSIIRSGFNDLTEVIPSLRNNNNSKSAILFKAVGYIKYLEKRNHSLRDRLSRLQLRLSLVKKSAIAATACSSHTEDSIAIQKRYPSNAGSSLCTSEQNELIKHTVLKTSNDSAYEQLPLDTVAALMAHKHQQKQLQELQEQLRMQRYLLKKHRIAIPEQLTDINDTLFTSVNGSEGRSLSYDYESIHIPSRRSSSSS